MMRTLASFSVLWLTLVLVGKAVTQSGHVAETPESKIKDMAAQSGSRYSGNELHRGQTVGLGYRGGGGFLPAVPCPWIGRAAPLVIGGCGEDRGVDPPAADFTARPAPRNDADDATEGSDGVDLPIVLVSAQVTTNGADGPQLEATAAAGTGVEADSGGGAPMQPRKNAMVISISDASGQNDARQEPRAGGEPDGPAPEQDPAALDKLGEKVAGENSPGHTTDEANPQSARTVELPEGLRALRDRLRDVLAYHIQRPEAVERRSPWGVMHALIAYGVDTEVRVGGRTVNAIGWLCWNGPCRGQQLMYLEDGKLHMKVGPGVQGHEGQFLAMLAQSRVRADYPIRIDGQSFAVKDLIEYEKRTCRPGTELTFKLIGLAHYLDTDEQWKSAWGELWDIPRLIREELAQPVIGAACGGTHRMMGFSYAVRRREKSGRPMTGQWLRARKYVDDYHEYTFKLQNPDGSFSTNWFAGPGPYGTADRKLETTGHILEWLVYSLPQEQLTDPRVIKAVTFLTDLMRDNPEYEWEIGPKGHALHALAIYDERLFGGQPGKRRLELAQHRSGSSSR